MFSFVFLNDVVVNTVKLWTLIIRLASYVEILAFLGILTTNLFHASAVY